VGPTSRFQTDLKRAVKRGYDIGSLTAVVKKLAAGETLEAGFNDHPLKGQHKGRRECHIAPDWLLIYERFDDGSTLYLIRTGTHSDLFE